MAEIRKKKKVWHKVKAPKAWRPVAGGELIGKYVHTDTSEGQYGIYHKHYVKNENGDTFFLSGAMSNALFSVVPMGTEVKVVYLGKKQSKTDSKRFYNDYELFTEQEIEFQIFKEM